MPDDLPIQLFLLASAVVVGAEAVKATGWRLWVFIGVCSAFVISAFAWPWLKGIYPPVTSWIGEIATSPHSWFLLIVLGLVLIAATGARKTRTAFPNVAEITASPETARDYSENLQQLNRTAFLVSSAGLDEIYRRRIEAAASMIPEHPGEHHFTSNSDMMAETNRLNSFLYTLLQDLEGSHWGVKFNSLMKQTELEASADLLRRDSTPDGLHSQHYRLFYIASMQRDRAVDFLSNAIRDARDYEQQNLQHLRERKRLHT